MRTASEKVYICVQPYKVSMRQQEAQNPLPTARVHLKQVRSFNGRSAFVAHGTSAGTLPVMTRDNLSFAKERLRLFSAVLIMERYEVCATLPV